MLYNQSESDLVLIKNYEDFANICNYYMNSAEK